MTKKWNTDGRRIRGCFGWIMILPLIFSGCGSRQEEKPEPISTEPQPATTAQQDTTAKTSKLEEQSVAIAEESAESSEKPRDLGSPLVENLAELRRLDPKEPVWIDAKKQQIVLLGEVCQAGYPLEFFATYANRSYESVVSVNVTPSIVHAGLLAVGAVPGHPARFTPEFAAPTGTEVAIEVRWKDAQGKVQSAPAQHWIRNITTKKELDCNWVFGGSQFVVDETTKKQYYQADSGELICVLSLPNAMLDLPIRSYGALEARQFEAFAEHLPPSETPVTILLKPIVQKPAEKPAASKSAKQLEGEKAAAEAAGVWLALADQSEFAKCWETASEPWKEKLERREFIKYMHDLRKPLGDLKSRKLLSTEYGVDMPNAPAGIYVVLKYQSSFAKKDSTAETIIPKLDKDKKWRVSGYSLH